MSRPAARAIDPARSASDGAVKKISPSKWPSFKDLWCAGVGSEPTSPISPKPTGATLGGYRLDGHEFGAGGYGRVLRAVHGRSGEVVAIKEMDETQVKLPSIIREVGALKRLGDKCEHVAGFRGYHVVGPKHYLIMEALPGGELFHHVTKADGCVAEAECRRLFAQVLSGLREAHAAGIAHRDLKLENIVLTADGRAKLVDFRALRAPPPRRPRRLRAAQAPRLLRFAFLLRARDGGARAVRRLRRRRVVVRRVRLRGGRRLLSL